MTLEATETQTPEPSNEELSSMLDALMGVIQPSGQDSAPDKGPVVDDQVQDTDEEASDTEVEAEVEPEKEQEAVEGQDSSAPDDRAELLRQINELSAELARTKAGGSTAVSTEGSPTPQSTPAPATPPVTTASLEVTEDEFAEALTSRDGMAKLMAKVYSAAVQHTMLQLPPLVQNVTAQQIAMNNAVADFYKKNEDLAPYKDFVAHMATQVASQHPDWPEHKVIEELPKVVREKLRLNAPVKQKAVPKKPAFATPTQAKAAPKGERIKTFEDEINELLNSGVARKI